MTKKLTKLETGLAVMSAVSDGQLDDATAADLRGVLDAAAAGQNLNRALERALSAARSRTWEAVADAANAAAAADGSRSSRSHLRAAVSSAAAVRRLELRLSGGSDDVQTDTPAGAVADAGIDTAAASSDAVVLHDETDTHEGVVLHTATDHEEVSQ